MTAALDRQDWAVDVKVSDGVDGVLPQSSITVAMNGDAGQALEGYDIKNGTLKYYLPAPGEVQEATRGCQGPQRAGTHWRTGSHPASDSGRA